MPGRKRNASPESTIDSSKHAAENEEYVVESIIRHRRYRKRVQYLIKWEGYDVEESTWEHETNLTNCPTILHPYQVENGIESESAQEKSTEKRQRTEAPPIDSDASSQVTAASQISSASGTENGDAEDSAEESVYESAPEDNLPDVASFGEGNSGDTDESSIAETGWDRGWTAKKVLGVTRYPDNSLWVLVAWNGGDHIPDLVPNMVANEKCPELMIEYYEAHLKWQIYPGKKKAGKRGSSE